MLINGKNRVGVSRWRIGYLLELYPLSMGRILHTIIMLIIALINQLCSFLSSLIVYESRLRKSNLILCIRILFL